MQNKQKYNKLNVLKFQSTKVIIEMVKADKLIFQAIKIYTFFRHQVGLFAFQFDAIMNCLYICTIN